MERTLILYHGGCPDGFGGAYAAWKKFGDSAEYIALKHQLLPPEGLSGAHLYFIDFCYPKEIMDTLVASAASVTVLDHHEGVREVVESMPSYVYDADHSGASIAWSYFHKGIPVPTLLQYVEDGDLYRFALPDSRALLSYAYTKPQTFADWDALVTELDVLESRQRATLRGTIYAEHFSILVGKIVERAKIVRFEGYECYFATGAEFFASDVGNRLARMKPPLALIAHVRLDGLRISLRGDGSVDVSKIAQKYGGNGHPNASAFSLPWGTPLPWEALEEKTTT